MNSFNIKFLLVFFLSLVCLKTSLAASVFGQGPEWNAEFAANALTEFNALMPDPEWVTALEKLPDNTWMKASPTGIPALASRFRSEVPMVYMPQFKAMFYTAGDGEEFGSYNSDSWVYSLSANTWVQMWPNYIKNSALNLEEYPQDRPAGRCSFGLGFDTDRGKLVLRGGANTGSQGLYTWEYDFAINAWERTAPQNNGYSRAEDNNLGFIPGFGVVEVGGDRNTPTGESETWVYRSDISGWEKITTNGAPPGAHNSRLVWAAKQQRLIFWADFSQLWAFDPATSTWENISPTSGPSPAGFYRHGMAYDLANDVIIMYGNNSAGSLITGPWVYSFVSRTWKNMNPEFRPADGGFGKQQSQQMAYDIEHNVVVVTGNGRGTWVYRYKKANSEPTRPIILTQPSDVMVMEGGDATFSVVATGSDPLSYQWFHNDLEIEGATNANYTISAASSSDEGLYRSKVSNELDPNGVDSQSAMLTIVADNVAPTLLSAFAVNDTRVDIVFSEPVSASSAENTANYQIDLGITVTSATLSEDARSVSLTVSPLTEATTYTVWVSNVTDLAETPNMIAANSRQEFTYLIADGFEDGNADGWTPLDANNWEVKMDEGDMAYCTRNAAPLSGSRLGEYSLLPTAYGDFSLTLSARLGADVDSNANADYAVVFGYQDPENYDYVMFNNNAAYTQLFKVVDGIRATALDTATDDWLTDNAYHEIKVSRVGDEIRVYYDGKRILKANDNSFGKGQIGVGSFNDPACFDDIRVTGEELVTEDTEAPVITLKGANPQQLTVGDPYTELGAMALDNIDGDLSALIDIDSSAVNTEVEGSYRVTYKVSDAEGNTATEVRTVKVTAATVISFASASFAALLGLGLVLLGFRFWYKYKAPNNVIRKNFMSKKRTFRMRYLWLALMLNITSISSTFAATYDANPSDYLTFLNQLKPGDTLVLAAGSYTDLLRVSNLQGTADKPIIITGPESGEPAIMLGKACCNTVTINNSSYLTIRHLTLNGLDIKYIDAVTSTGITHHITLEYLEIVRHGGAQLTNGISTRGPAWDWIIRNNKIIGAGTGMYLGDSEGTRWPFVGGLIEHNLLVDTVGYNVQFKHTISRADVNGNVIPGMPQEKRKTIIRHNVFSKANQPPGSIGPRPNLLVGHFPLTGPGSDDVYEIYGNLFYENTNEALFQGEGNIALYDNLFVNSSESAINIQPHNEVPRNINVFHNTVVATGGGILVSGANTEFVQRVVGNAVFASTPIAVNAAAVQEDNVTDTYASASDYLLSPEGDPEQGTLDLFPVMDMLLANAIDMTAFEQFSDGNLDFNGNPRTGVFRGAYAGQTNNNGWALALDIKPALNSVALPINILTQPQAITVTEGEDANFKVVAVAGGGPLTYQWYRDETLIDNATSANYTVENVSAMDDGSMYRCEVSNVVDGVEEIVPCDSAELSVLKDTTAPMLESALVINATRVDLVFSEAVSVSSAGDMGNYQMDLGIVVASASLQDDARTVSLTVSQLTEDTTYTVQVSNVQDLAPSPNTMAPSSKTFTYRTADDFEDKNADGWTPLTLSRWKVVEENDGNQAYHLNTTEFDSLSGKRLGEYSLLSPDYGDFTLTARAKLGDDIDNGSNALADYAVIFGFENEYNYYYVIFNNSQNASQLFKVTGGDRGTALATANADWLNDNAYHTIKITRVGAATAVYFDGSEMMKVDENTSGVGQVGVGSYNDSAYFDDVKVVGKVTITPDTTPPVITLVGNNPQTITLGDAYTELGAKAEDNVDGDISAKITINASAVNTNAMGIYEVTYNVMDAADNAADEKIRKVQVTAVADTTPPVITLVGNNPQIITLGDAYTELGAKAEDNVDGDISGEITINASAVKTNVVGTYEVTYNVKDDAGNTALEITRVVKVMAAGGEDNIAPVITLNGNASITITVDGVYVEAGAIALDNLDGDISGKIIINDSAVDTSIVGTYEITYNVSDEAGNAATPMIRTVNITAATVIKVSAFGGPLLAGLGFLLLALRLRYQHRNLIS